MININHAIKCLMFDLGNTLYPHSMQKKAWKVALNELEIDRETFFAEYSKQNIENAGGFSSIAKLEYVFKAIGNDFSKEKITSILNRYQDSLRSEIRDYILQDPHGVFEFLKYAKSYFTLGILSDNSIETKKEWLKLLEESGYPDLLDFFIVSEELGKEKSDPTTFDLVLSQIKFHPEEILYFGDNLSRDAHCLIFDIEFIHVNGFIGEGSAKYQSIPYINNSQIKISQEA